MARASKLIAAKRGRVLLVRRRRDGLWMFPGGRKRAREDDKACLRREIKEELPKLKLGRLRLWKEVKSKNRRSGRKMSDAIFHRQKGDRTTRYWRQKRNRPRGLAQAARHPADTDLSLHQGQTFSEAIIALDRLSIPANVVGPPCSAIRIDALTA